MRIMNLQQLKDIIASNFLVKIYSTMASFHYSDMTHQFVLRGDPAFAGQVHPDRYRLSIGQCTFQALHGCGARLCRQICNMVSNPCSWLCRQSNIVVSIPSLMFILFNKSYIRAKVVPLYIHARTRAYLCCGDQR